MDNFLATIEYRSLMSNPVPWVIKYFFLSPLFYLVSPIEMIIYFTSKKGALAKGLASRELQHKMQHKSTTQLNMQPQVKQLFKC